MSDFIEMVQRGGARVHKKRDGYLYVEMDGTCRFLTWREGIIWRWHLLLAALGIKSGPRP